MEGLFISSARHVRFANIQGIRKIIRNVIAVRQNLKTLSSWSPNSDFERAREFYGLFSLGPQVRCSGYIRIDATHHVCLSVFFLLLFQGLLDTIKKEKKFTFEEYQAMLNLQCGVDQVNNQSGANQASDRNYSMYMIELHGLDLEHSNPDQSA